MTGRRTHYDHEHSKCLAEIKLFDPVVTTRRKDHSRVQVQSLNDLNMNDSLLRDISIRRAGHEVEIRLSLIYCLSYDGSHRGEDGSGGAPAELVFFDCFGMIGTLRLWTTHDVDIRTGETLTHEQSLPILRELAMGPFQPPHDIRVHRIETYTTGSELHIACRRVQLMLHPADKSTSP